MRELLRRIVSHIISFEEARRLIIKSLGMKPKKGGRPPSESNAMNDIVFTFVFGMELICLK